VPRLADDSTTESAAKQLQKTADAASIEGVRRRQLNEQRPTLRAQSGDFINETIQGIARASEFALVRDHLGDLDGEPE
jgi:hypothetical protein